MTLADSLRQVVALKDSLLAVPTTRPPSNVTSALPVLVSAFFGAFFAFLFTRLGGWLTGKLARGKEHKRALARTERLCQDYLNDIITNKKLTGRAVEALAAGVPYWQFPHPFAIDQSLTMEIIDLDMATRVASVNTRLRRFNRNVEDFRRAHDDLQKAMLAQSIPGDVWAAASQRAAPLWSEFVPFLDHLDNEVRDLCTRAVLLVRQYESRRARLLRAVGILRCWRLREAEVAQARKQFDEEREKLLAASRERMAQARSGATTAIFSLPAKWEAFARRRPWLREAMPRLHHLMEGAFIRTLTDPTDDDHAVFYLGRLCVEDFFEILLMCGNGYGIGGKKLLRGLYERAVTAWYLHHHPAKARDFKDHWRIQKHKNALALRKLFGDRFATDAQMAALKEQADEVIDRFTTSTRKGKKRVQQMWTQLSVAAQAQKFPDIHRYHELAYTDTLAHVHANYGGIEQRLEIKEDGISFGDKTPPGDDDAVLTAAHAIVLQALRLQIEHFKLTSLEGEVASCVKDHQMVWEKEPPTKT